MKIYDSNYLEVMAHTDQHYLEAIWKPSTKTATEDDFKAWNNDLAHLVEQYQPECLLANCLTYLFMISVELQEWSTENVFSRYQAAGLRKIAILMPAEFMPKLALELFAEEAKNEIITYYFDGQEKALEWLLIQ